MEKEVVLITGCSSGLGRQLCILLESKGYLVAASARNMEKLKDVPADYRVELDVTNEKSVRNAVEKVMERYGRIDILINNAGYSVRAAVEETDLKELSKMFDVNLYGMIRMIQAAAPFMRQRNSGKIINIGSISGRLTGGVNGGYCASKHAVEAITEAARMELKGFGIQVSVLEPGAVDTDFFRTLSRNSDQRMKNEQSPYRTLYSADLDYRAGQKRADAGKAAEEICSVISRKKLRTRYGIVLPRIFALMAVLPDSIREKAMLHSSKQQIHDSLKR